MTQRVDVVRADKSHIKQIAELEKSCIPDGWSESAFEQALGNPNALIFAAVRDGEVVGFLNGSYVLDEAELLNIAVSEKHRKSGIAGILLAAFEEELRKFGVKTVYLEVRESNAPARGLYEKHGFTQNGLRKNYYRSPVENAVLMVKMI
jgi:ribosomal-protein-alanine N-acetyltransferase